MSRACLATVLVVASLLGLAVAPASAQRSAGLEERILDSQAMLLGDSSARADELLEAVDADPTAPTAELALRLLADNWNDLPSSRPYVMRLMELRERAGPYAAEIARNLCLQAMLELGDDAAAEHLAAAYRALGPWASIAPFGTSSPGDFDRVFAVENDDDPARSHTGHGKERSWKPVRVRDPRAVGPPITDEDGNGWAYARTVFTLSRPLRGFLMVEVGPSWKVWVDEQLVGVADSYGAYPLREANIPLELSAGKHRLLLKAQVGARLVVRLLDSDGEPVACPAGDPLEPFAPVEGDWGTVKAAPGLTSGAAIDHYRRIYEQEGLESEGGAWAGIAYAYLADTLGDPDIGLDALERSVPAAGSPPGPMMLLGAALLNTRLRPAALAEQAARTHMETVGEMAPQSVLASIFLAKFEQSRDRHAEAIGLLEAALVRVPENSAVWTSLADLYADKGWNEEAREVLSALLETSPDDVRVMERLARVERARGNYAADRELRRRLAKDSPGDERLQRWAFLDAELQGDGATAEAILRRQIAARPQDDSVRMELVGFLVRARRHQEALDQLDTLIAEDPEDAGLRAQRGELLVLLERRADAVGAFREALEIDPSRQELREYVAFLTETETDLASRHLVWLADFADVPGAADYPEAASVLVLDEAVLRVYPDGSFVSDVYSCRKVLTKEGVSSVASARYGGELLLARTHLADGSVLEPIQVGGGGFEMPGVDVGSIVELRYRVRNRGDEGRFTNYTWYFQDTDYSEPFHLSRLVVILPRSMPRLEIDERNFEGTHEVKEAGDSIVHTWEVRRSPRIIPEWNMPPAVEVVPLVHIETPSEWEDVFFAGRGFRRAARPSQVIDRKAGELLEGVEGDLARARVLYEFVNSHVEQDGGGDPTVTLLAGQGDRRRLFGALAASAGLDVASIEIGPNPSVGAPFDYEFPQDVFREVALLALSVDGELTFLDFSSRFLPFGQITDGLGGSLALIHLADGSRLTQMPEPAAERAAEVHEAQMTVHADGVVSVRGSYRWNGTQGARIKQAFESWEPQVRRQRVQQTMGSFYPGFRLTAYDVPGISVPGSPMVLEFEGESRLLLVQKGEVHTLQPGFVSIDLVRALLRESDRKFDYVSEVRQSLSSRLRVVLEEGVTVAGIPRPSVLLSSLGSFQQSYKRDGSSAVVAERQLRLWPGRVAPGQYPALVSFCRGADRSKEALLELRLE